MIFNFFLSNFQRNTCLVLTLFLIDNLKLLKADPILEVPMRIETSKIANTNFKKITAQDLSHYGIENLTQALEYFSTLEIVGYGSRGQTQSLFYRGSNSDHTKLLVNGVPYLSVSDSFNLDHFSLDNLDYIEIKRFDEGYQSAGLVINLVTKYKAQDSLSNFIGKNGSLGFGFNKQITSNVQLSMNKEKTQGSNFKNTNDHYAYQQQSARLNYQHSLDTILNTGQFEYWASQVEYDQFGSKYLQTDKRYQFQNNLQTENNNWLFNATLIENEHQPIHIDTIETEHRFLHLYSKYLSNHQLDNFDLRYGGDVSYLYLNQGALSRSSPHNLAGTDRVLTSLFLDSTYRLNQFELHNFYKIESQKNHTPNEAYALFIDYGEQNWKLSGGYSHSYHLPSFEDLGSNPNLTVEESDEWSLLIFKNTIINKAIWDKQVTFYDKKIKNLTIWYQYPGHVWLPEQLNGNIQGVEFETSIRKNKLHGFMIFEYKSPKDDNNIPLARRAKKTAKSGLSYQFTQQLNMGVIYNYVGKSLDLPVKSTKDQVWLDEYEYWDFNLEYQPFSQLKLAFKVNNLFDHKYETAIGYLGDARYYQGMLKYYF